MTRGRNHHLDAPRAAAGPAPTATGRLGYLVKCFPRVSETFILNEVLELERLGLDLRVYSMISPREKKRHPKADEVRSPVTYLPYPLLPATLRYLAAHARLCWRFPRRYLATLLEVIGMRDRDLGERFIQAGYLAQLLERDGVEHVHAGFVHSPGSVAWIVHRITGVPFSVATHAKDFYHSPPKLLRKKLRDTELVLTCTQYNVPRIEQMGAPRGIRRLRRVYHGTDLARYPYGPCGQADPPLILAVARLVEKKGLDSLIRACARLRDRGRGFRCRIIGDGAWRGRLAALVEELDLESLVSLEGALAQDEVQRWYPQATVFALPCLITGDGDRDGIPNALVEATATGVPVVTTAVSGIPELIRDGETGLIVPPRDPDALAASIERLLDDPPLREQLRSRARAFVEKEFDLHRNVLIVARELQGLLLPPGEAPLPRPRVSTSEPELAERVTTA